MEIGIYEGMRRIAECYPEINNEEAVRRFKESGDEGYIAVVFCGVYGTIRKISAEFSTIDEQEKESIAVEQVLKVMTKFDTEAGNKVNTVFTHYYRNRLLTAVETQNYDKYRVETEAISYDTEEGTYDVEYTAPEFEELEMVDFIYRHPDLTPQEKEYCLLIIGEYGITDRDIAKRLGVSPSRITQIKYSLREKVGKNLLAG